MKKVALRPILAGLALAIAATATVAAPAPTTDAQSTATAVHKGGPGHRGPHAGMRDGLFIPGLGPIGKQQVDALKLDAPQTAKLTTARDAQRSLMERMHTARQAHEKALNDQIAAGKLDPHALVDSSESEHGRFKAEADKVRADWLAVWDSLNDGQRKQVTGFVKERQARMARERAAHPRQGGEEQPGNAPDARLPG